MKTHFVVVVRRCDRTSWKETPWIHYTRTSEIAYFSIAQPPPSHAVAGILYSISDCIVWKCSMQASIEHLVLCAFQGQQRPTHGLMLRRQRTYINSKTLFRHIAECLVAMVIDSVTLHCPSYDIVRISFRFVVYRIYSHTSHTHTTTRCVVWCGVLNPFRSATARRKLSSVNQNWENIQQVNSTSIPRFRIMFSRWLLSRLVCIEMCERENRIYNEVCWSINWIEKLT